MKKPLIISAIAVGVIAVSTSAAALNKSKLNVLNANAGTRGASIVLNASNLVVGDTSGDPWYDEFSFSTETESHYEFKVKNCTVGGESVEFKKGINDITYVFVSDAPTYGPSNAYYDIDINLENLYSFTNVVVKGIFINSSGTHYQYTFTTSDTSNVEWKPELEMAALHLGSGDLENNYSYIALESITINYSCAN